MRPLLAALAFLAFVTHAEAAFDCEIFKRNAEIMSDGECQSAGCQASAAEFMAGYNDCLADYAAIGVAQPSAGGGQPSSQTRQPSAAPTPLPPSSRPTPTVSKPTTVGQKTKTKLTQNSAQKTYVDENGNQCLSVSFVDLPQRTTEGPWTRHEAKIQNSCGHSYNITFNLGSGRTGEAGVAPYQTRTWFCTTGAWMNKDCNGVTSWSAR